MQRPIFRGLAVLKSSQQFLESVCRPMRCNSIKLISRGNKTPMIGGPGPPDGGGRYQHTESGLVNRRNWVLWIIGERLKRQKKKTYNNEPKNGQRDRRILGEGSVSFANWLRGPMHLCVRRTKIADPVLHDQIKWNIDDALRDEYPAVYEQSDPLIHKRALRIMGCKMHL